MDLLKAFQDHWQKQFAQLTKSNCCLLVTVSGGSDSVVLLDLVARSGFPYQIAHANFQLRANESERDESFVKKLGEKYGKTVFCKHFETSTYATEMKCSIQEAARTLRYQWFRELTARMESEENNPSQNISGYIVTAHHADDNIETLLMHFFRGTGLQGLTGIPALDTQRKLVRPLLPFPKLTLLNYAAENQLAFVEDTSNASDKYTRNYFRNSLLPQIREVFPMVEDNLRNNISRFAEIWEIYHQSVAQQLQQLKERVGEEWHIPVMKWEKLTPLHTLSWELIKPFGFTAAQTPEIIKLLDAANGAFVASATHRIIKNRNWIIISPNSGSDLQHIPIEVEEGSIAFENGRITLSIRQLSASNTTDLPLWNRDAGQENVSFDRDELPSPLLLRKWKQGDYFYPLGMRKKKKISRFLIDLKLSRTEKEKIWVLTSDKKIIWVVGLRMDDRFKLTPRTQTILDIHYLR